MHISSRGPALTVCTLWHGRCCVMKRLSLPPGPFPDDFPRIFSVDSACVSLLTRRLDLPRFGGLFVMKLKFVRRTESSGLCERPWLPSLARDVPLGQVPPRGCEQLSCNFASCFLLTHEGLEEFVGLCACLHMYVCVCVCVYVFCLNKKKEFTIGSVNSVIYEDVFLCERNRAALSLPRRWYEWHVCICLYSLVSSLKKLYPVVLYNSAL